MIDAAARVLWNAAVIAALSPAAWAVDSVRERATGAEFASRVDFRHGGRAYALQLTGLAVRRIAFFKVYGMAHYVEAPRGPSPMTSEGLLSHVLSDTVAKQVTMQFARNIGGDRISTALVKSLRRDASEAQLAAARPAIERFAKVVRHDVKKGERFTVRWLPGGRTVCLFDDQEVLALHNPVFARLFWSMWFGERPVVDRDALLELRSG